MNKEIYVNIFHYIIKLEIDKHACVSRHRTTITVSFKRRKPIKLTKIIDTNAFQLFTLQKFRITAIKTGSGCLQMGFESWACVR